MLEKHHVRRVVDFGSGNGRLTIPLLQSGYAVIAVDISTSSLAELRQRVKRMGYAARLKTAADLPSGEDVEAVVGTDILHHLDLISSLPQIRQTVKNGGVVVFSEPNILNPAWIFFITFFLDWRIEWRIIFCHYFSLKNKLKQTGFRHITIRGLGLFPPPIFAGIPIFDRLNYILGSLPVLKLFAYRLIVEAF